ncbi:hypothetical protein LPB140_06235 [Sphingorhabdus lutea]|uniref:AAA+ ATPase domain-containing protein n=1 Tax=Sphingorhabdus lutea TaxID=1913578 RepID=A0A1L3JBD6_9SPHN|nr:XrtA/PEP-CTERM system-associated ATPase [Sphingorhabdus lutea]APG62454.1 hypothetical protein LPB140_06235 [Sphingorhabdus lutea]
MYDQFYQLNGRPFQLTPDPEFYFESVTHRKALSYLGYGLAQGEGFIVITGDVGAGKTTLVSHLMASIDRQRLTAATIVTSQLDGHDMVQMAAECFGISTQNKDKAATLKEIELFLHEEARHGRRCLLIVDEAQNLQISALEELRMLSNFQLGSSALLQIFLLGQPEFRDLIKNSAQLEQLRQRVIANHHLDPMDSDEVRPYIEYRLSQAGWAGNPSFEQDSFAAIYDETNGVPRKINALMQRVLLMGAVEELHVIDANLVRAVVADMAGQPFEYEAPMSAKASADELAAMHQSSMQNEHHDIEMAQMAEAEEAEAEIEVEAKIEAEAEIEEVNQVVAEKSKPAEEIMAAQILDAPATPPIVSAPIDHARFDAIEKKLAEQDALLRQLMVAMTDLLDKDYQENLSRAHRAA